MKAVPVFHYIIEVRKWFSLNLKRIAFVLSTAVAVLGILSSLIQIRGGSGSDFFVAMQAVLLGWFTYWMEYLVDWRVSLFVFVIAMLVVEVAYQSREKRLRILMLARKSAIDERLCTLSPPDGHYLALVIGKLGERARAIQRRRAKDIIESINKNIKKDEEVYWISLSEIGILMYEAKGREPEYFLNVIFYGKLPLQLNSQREARRFAKDITFAMVKPHPGAKLEDIEFAARNALELRAFCLNDIGIGKPPPETASPPATQ